MNFSNNFYNPPKGYGNVPFYWWNAEELTWEKLSYQINELASKGISGMQVNFAHAYRGGINNEIYGGHGKTLPAYPELFSEDWWKIWDFAVEKCFEHGMSIGMGDYTVAWIGNGYYTDEISALPGMKAKELFCDAKNVHKNDCIASSKSNLICAVFYPENKDTAPLPVSGTFTAPSAGRFYEIYFVEKERSINPLNPQCGKLVVEKYFKKFEERSPEKCGNGLNYFFQDELMFGTDCKRLWSADLPNNFLSEKGYDLLPFLPALFENIGNITAKVRLDYADVKTQMIEDSYFKDIYNFHAGHNMIYGCDQNSRGLSPDEYSDYFRTVRWFTAPGNDTPGRSADLLKVKVNSSIAHLYERPRVWLEGYHSSGWGTTLESITAPTSDNFLYGANLLNLHGLYYSTLGGFWEWAPPDFHFRMPYWDDEAVWLKKYERLSWLLTQGVHRCDAAVFYPVSSFDVGEKAEACLNATFNIAREIYEQGIDFDFIDFQSICRAKTEDGKLCVAGEEYKVLIFAGVDAIRYCVIEKIKEFIESGGKVIFVECLPNSSDRTGSNDAVLADEIEKFLKSKNCILTKGSEDAIDFINTNVARDFFPIGNVEQANVHQRVTPFGKLFFIRNCPQGTLCRLFSSESAYVLNPCTGSISKLEIESSYGGFTTLRLPFSSHEDTLILFTNSLPHVNEVISFEKEIIQSKETIPLPNRWHFDIVPTLDNSYGDFYLPASEEKIGAQARFFECVDFESDFNGKIQTYSKSPTFKRIDIDAKNFDSALKELCACSSPLSESEIFINGMRYNIEQCNLWDRYGYIDSSTAEQGFHGLKGTIFNDNIYYKNDCIFISSVNCVSGNHLLSFGHILPSRIFINGVETLAKSGEVFLKKGCNIIFAAYRFLPSDNFDLRSSEETRRSHILFEKIGQADSKEYFPLKTAWFANEKYLKFCSEDCGSKFKFKFKSIPALSALSIRCFGELTELTNNGKRQTIIPTGKTPYGANKYNIQINNICPDSGEIIFNVFADAAMGYSFSGLIPEPIELFQHPGTGMLELGDWCESGALRCFSGKGKYSCSFDFNYETKPKKIILFLGVVSATCSIRLNGEDIGSLTYSPFNVNISHAVKKGRNLLEVTVSNTLCNHYSTIPSRYSNYPQDSASGLLGPVEIHIYQE